jgi:hypothetical protein
MPKTALGLLQNSSRADEAVRQIEALGFPANALHKIEEPGVFPVDGVTSFPRLDFEVAMRRELVRIGATEEEADACVEHLRRGGAVVLVTGGDEDAKVDAAASVMDRLGAERTDETTGPKPDLPPSYRIGAAATPERPLQTGRIRQSESTFFVW